ncbi:unnamed protein product [Calicophoron daubneyi]|uniref:Uncharacterized protein n=1 Tax=Calicophoron daubneyi TaxID=300641 RepID=A0AAV2TKI1_CALDB
MPTLGGYKASRSPADSARLQSGTTDKNVEMFNKKLDDLHRIYTKNLMEKMDREIKKSIIRTMEAHTEAQRVGELNRQVKGSRKIWEGVINEKPFRSPFVRPTQPSASVSRTHTNKDTEPDLKHWRRKKGRKIEQKQTILVRTPRVKTRAILSARPLASRASVVKIKPKLHPIRPATTSSFYSVVSASSFGLPSSGRVNFLSRSYLELTRRIHAGKFPGISYSRGFSRSQTYTGSGYDERGMETGSPTFRSFLSADDPLYVYGQRNISREQSCRRRIAELKSAAPELRARVSRFCDKISAFTDECQKLAKNKADKAQNGLFDDSISIGLTF